MMIDPPIDKLVSKVGCKYALVCVVTERAKYLLDKHNDMMENSAERAIAYAAREVYNDKVEAHYEGND